MAKKDIKHVGLRVDVRVHQKLAYIADYEGRTLNGQVYYLIQNCIRQFEREHGSITGADIENGRA